MSHETNLSFLGDPSAASEDLELLTAVLCEAAWNEFRQIEAEGGLLASLLAGKLQARIAHERDRRAAAFMRQDRKIVGTTIHIASGTDRVSTLKADRRAPQTDGVVFCERLPAIRFDQLLGATDTADGEDEG